MFKYLLLNVVYFNLCNIYTFRGLFIYLFSNKYINLLLYKYSRSSLYMLLNLHHNHILLLLLKATFSNDIYITFMKISGTVGSVEINTTTSPTEVTVHP